MAVAVLIASASHAIAEPVRGVVAHLVVTGDLDSRALADEIVAWFARRDPATEVLAVVSLNAARARPDLATRIADAVRTSAVPVAVHLDARGSVEPQTLLIGLCARSVWVSSGVSLAGDETTRLPGLCPDSAWAGANERLARTVLAGRDELLLDLFVAPLASVYLLGDRAERTLARESGDTEGRRIVARTNDDQWRVRVAREELIDLGLAAGADGLGEVLRACNVRAFRRDRTQLQSGLGEAREQVERLRSDISTRVVRLRTDLRAVRSLDARDRDRGIEGLRAGVSDAQRELDSARSLFDLYPELSRQSPPWTFHADPERAGKEWAGAFESLAEDLDDLRSQIDALESP